MTGRRRSEEWQGLESYRFIGPNVEATDVWDQAGKGSLTNGHDARVRKDLLGKVIDELSVDEAVDVV